jgi:hypothetical protein
MDEAFVKEFKQLLGITDRYLETFYNYLDTEMLELATITIKNLGKVLPEHIKKVESLPEPANEALKKIWDSYAEWLEVQLRNCRLLDEYEDNPNDGNLKKWQQSFKRAEALQKETGRFILESKVF